MKLIDYIRGKRRGRGAHRTELEAMRDPLLGDALEGYDTVPGDHLPALERLERRIAGRTRAATGEPAPMVADRAPRRMLRWYVAAAAAVIACVIGGTVLFLQRDSLTGADEPLVAQKIAKETPEDGTPAADKASEKEQNAPTETPAAVEPVIKEVPKPAEKALAELTKLHSPAESADGEIIIGEEMEIATQEEVRITLPSISPEPPAEIPPPETAAALQGRVAGIAADKTPDSELSEVVVVAYGTRKKSELTGAVETAGETTGETAGKMPADTTLTAEFRRYIAAESAESGIEGSATLEFEVDNLGRPYRIKTVESTSGKAGREAVRLLRKGPDWEPTESRKSIVITFTRQES